MVDPLQIKEAIKAPFRWIPIRALSPHHRPKLSQHLLALEPADRYLRFGYSASDAQILAYVEHLNFQRDEIFGVFSRRLEITAFAHLAYLPDGVGLSHQAEFGVSVLARARGRGYGQRLFDHAVLHARNRNVDTLIIQALSENTAMLRIVRKAGALIDRDGSESEARLTLPPETLASHVEAFVEEGAAELDYGLKLHARTMRVVGQFFSRGQTGESAMNPGAARPGGAAAE
jgi:RimJ/RimL family protein N-acetyltransferase